MLGGFNHFPTHLNSWTSITVESSHTKHAIFSWLYPHLMMLTHPVLGAVSRRYLWSPLMSSARPSSSWCPANPPCASSNRPHPKHRNCRRRPKGTHKVGWSVGHFRVLNIVSPWSFRGLVNLNLFPSPKSKARDKQSQTEQVFYWAIPIIGKSKADRTNSHRSQPAPGATVQSVQVWCQ